MSTSSVLDREEYIEQAYFFRCFRERLLDNIPAQEILQSIHEEILITTRLPVAIEFLRGEIVHHGRLAEGMARLAHYFTPFQTYILSRAEEERTRFDLRIALQVLQHEAEYRALPGTAQGLFVYQFECLSRNRLGFDRGLEAIAGDPWFDDTWRAWILRSRHWLGTIDFGELLYRTSEQWVLDRQRKDKSFAPAEDLPLLFGPREGRIAWANRGRDPLYLFAALQRQLGYPAVPRFKPPTGPEKLIPELQLTVRNLEKRVQILEAEVRGTFDLSPYYVQPDQAPQFRDDPATLRDLPAPPAGDAPTA